MACNINAVKGAISREPCGLLAACLAYWAISRLGKDTNSRRNVDDIGRMIPKLSSGFHVQYTYIHTYWHIYVNTYISTKNNGKRNITGEKNHYVWCKSCQKELRPDINLPESNSGNRTYFIFS